MELTDLQKAWLAARETSEAEIALLTVYHPKMGVYRLARNTEDIVSRGQTYSYCYFEPSIVSDDDSPARAQLVVPNVNGVGRRLVMELKKLTDDVYITLEIVNEAFPDVPVSKAARMRYQDITIDVISITGNLVRQDHGTENFGKIKVIPSKFPALFRTV